MKRLLLSMLLIVGSVVCSLNMLADVNAEFWNTSEVPMWVYFDFKDVRNKTKWSAGLIKGLKQNAVAIAPGQSLEMKDVDVSEPLFAFVSRVAPSSWLASSNVTAVGFAPGRDLYVQLRVDVRDKDNVLVEPQPSSWWSRTTPHGYDARNNVAVRDILVKKLTIDDFLRCFTERQQGWCLFHKAFK